MVLCRVSVSVRGSVSCRMGGSCLMDKWISMLIEGKIRVSRTALFIVCFDSLHRKQ